MVIREALEDFEYTTLASTQGHQARVDEIVGSLARSFTDWSPSPEAYLAARAKLAALIAAETEGTKPAKRTEATRMNSRSIPS